jgi:hypothetical protein
LGWNWVCLGLFFCPASGINISYLFVITDVMFIWSFWKLGLFCINKSAGSPGPIDRVRGAGLDRRFGKEKVKREKAKIVDSVAMISP